MTGGPQDDRDPDLETSRDLDRFLGEPTRDLADWQWLWAGDHSFPIRSHRGLLGRFLVRLKRWLRPLVKTPQNDLWERQRVFNLILAEHLLERRKRRREERHEERIRHLEAFLQEGLREVTRHDDALFARVDQKLDRYRREAKQLQDALGSALALVEGGEATEGQKRPAAVETLRRNWQEEGYLELEERYRGTREDIEERIRRYLPYLEGREPVLDLGCGRGEALAVLAGHGITARGVDGSERMVETCRAQGLSVEAGDLFDALASCPEASLGAVVSFHVIEHLPAESLDRLVRLAWRALRPGGVLILETPNPLSVVVAARNFWLDPTHRRPVHPRSLELSFRHAGFEPVEFLPLRPFPPQERLPELDLGALPPEQHALADRINRLRDRLDEVLFGEQDYALIGTKAA